MWLADTLVYCKIVHVTRFAKYRELWRVMFRWPYQTSRYKGTRQTSLFWRYIACEQKTHFWSSLLSLSEGERRPPETDTSPQLLCSFYLTLYKTDISPKIVPKISALEKKEPAKVLDNWQVSIMTRERPWPYSVKNRIRGGCDKLF